MRTSVVPPTKASGKTTPEPQVYEGTLVPNDSHGRMDRGGSKGSGGRHGAGGRGGEGGHRYDGGPQLKPKTPEEVGFGPYSEIHACMPRISDELRYSVRDITAGRVFEQLGLIKRLELSEKKSDAAQRLVEVVRKDLRRLSSGVQEQMRKVHLLLKTHCRSRHKTPRRALPPQWRRRRPKSPRRTLLLHWRRRRPRRCTYWASLTVFVCLHKQISTQVSCQWMASHPKLALQAAEPKTTKKLTALLAGSGSCTLLRRTLARVRRRMISLPTPQWCLPTFPRQPAPQVMVLVLSCNSEDCARISTSKT